MAVAFRSASDTGDAVNTSTRAPAVPAGVQVQDVVVAFVETWNGDVTVTPPAGFAQKGAAWTSGDGAARCSTWWKRLTAADTGTYGWTLGSARYVTVQQMAFSGVVTTGDPFEAVATPVAGSFGSVTSMSVDAAAAGGALVWGLYNDSNGTHTPPTGFTEAAEVDCASQAYKLITTSGTQTASGASITSTSPAGAWLGALLADTGGGAATSLLIPRRPGRGLILR